MFYFSKNIRFIKFNLRKYFILISFVVFTGCLHNYEIKKEEKEKDEIIVINPYENINWEKIKRYKANLHAHTVESDGKETPENVINLYKMKNYSVLAITDHNKYIRLKQSDLFLIPGVEFGKNTHHILAYFSFKIPENIEKLNEEDILSFIDEKYGISVFSHPGRYKKPIDWYLKLFEKYENLIGLEVLNPSVQSKGKIYGDTDIWDEILKRTMPNRPIWGFGNDDFHDIKQFCINWNIFLIENLTQEEIRDAIKKGKFYICSAILGPSMPYLKRIIFEKKQGRIKIDCGNCKKIKWISDGKVIGYGNEIKYKKNPLIKKYIRVEIFGDEGYIYLNPIGIKNE